MPVCDWGTTFFHPINEWTLYLGVESYESVGLFPCNSRFTTNFDVDWAIVNGYKIPSPVMPHYRSFICIATLPFMHRYWLKWISIRIIRPLAQIPVFQCHGPDAAQREADLRLDTKEGLFGDLDGFKVVAPGDAGSERAVLSHRS